LWWYGKGGWPGVSEQAEPQPGDDAPLDPGLLEILVCPDCKAPIAQEGAWLVCQRPTCALRYPIRDGIPVMLIEEAVDPKKRAQT
jgi:uncharacterized protein YbaR (Trm112 family)